MTDETTMRPADFAAVLNGNGGNGGYSNGWGGDWSSWIIIFLIFALTGFGGRGMFGGMGGNIGGGCGGYVPCATQADVRAAVDQQTLISKLDQQTYGLADSTYALNNTISNGFSQAELSRCNQQAALMGQLNNMAMNDAKCCCETQRLIERGFADTNYNLATQSCDTRNTIQNATRDIVDNQNCNTRAILDALTAQRIADKDAKIAEQTQTIFGLQLAASQAKQNAYLVNELRPCPVPAYITCNPYAASYGYSGNNCGCGCTNSF